MHQSPAQINCWVRAPRRSRNHHDTCPSLSSSRSVSPAVFVAPGQTHSWRTSSSAHILADITSGMTGSWLVSQTDKRLAPRLLLLPCAPGLCVILGVGVCAVLDARVRSVTKRDQARRRKQCSLPTSLVALLAHTSAGASTHRQLTCSPNVSYNKK